MSNINKEQQDRDKWLIKETLAHAKNVWNKNDSDLAGHVLNKMGDKIGKTIDLKINGKLARLDQKLTDHLESEEKLLEALKKLSEQTEKNTSFRLKYIGGLATMKFLLSFIGLGTITSLILQFVK